MSFSNLWQSLNKRLPNNRTFIVPTRLGLYFSILCLILLGIAFIYNNNIAYLSCFSLTSLGLITMFQTNFNMERLKLSVLPPQDVHADHPCKIKVLIENKSTQPVYEVTLQIGSDGESVSIPSIAPKQVFDADMIVTMSHRGLHPLPAAIAQTTFPFGLLRSWKILRPAEKILVFPARKGSLAIPEQGTASAQEEAFQRKAKSMGDEFLGHRPYQSFDSLRHIDWKAYARQQKFNVKLFENDHQGTQLLSWSHTQSLTNNEERISQLSQWIHLCLRKKQKFILEIPGWTSPTESSPNHTTDCLTHLALLELPAQQKTEKL